MKLIARKCKDGWIVDIKETRFFKSRRMVDKTIKSLDLAINNGVSTTNRIYAEETK